jgi:hypothetical protein
MAQRNQIGRALGGQNAGEPRDLQRIAFLDRFRPDSAHGLGAHPHRRFRDGLALRFRLGRHIDHADPAALVDVRQLR